MPVGERARVSAPAFGTRRVIEGKGPCVVLIHGVGLDQSMWHAQAKTLSSDFTVVRYDLPGHGGTAPAPGGLELDHLVSQIAALLDDEGIADAHVVGFSLGALIAQAFALAHPERILRLVLVSGVYHRDDAARNAVLKRLQQAEQDGPASIADAAIKRWFTDAFRRTHPGEVAKIEQRLRANTPEGFLPAYRLFANADAQLAGRLGEIKAPALVITGENDTGSTPDMARRMSKAMPSAEYRIIPGIRHMLPLQAAEEFNTVLKAFFLKSEKKR